VSQIPVPFVDLAAQAAEIADEVAVGFEAVLAKTAFISGPAVREFEQSYEAFAGVRNCVGVGNGTDALEFALRAAGVGAGDEVIVPVNTFIATAAAVVRAGARPVFVDIDPDTYLIDVELAAAAIGPRTRAIVPVHLYGQMAPMAALADAIRGHDGIVLVEDAAQSQGATQNGRSAGTLGISAGTSFYPGKNLGAYGDAGAVLTDDDAVADVARLLRDHGSRVKYEHEMVGWNSCLDTLQAVVLNAKLKRLPAWNAARRAAASRYDEMLADLDQIGRPTTAPGNEHVWHLYVVRTPDRDRVLSELGEAGIGVGIHYPLPIHLQGAFSEFSSGRGTFPIAEAAADSILSLPMYPHLLPEQQERVVSARRSSVTAGAYR
jgi:dTDP-4-amino-4,6-dideoxygalactose transaminase